MNHIDKYFMKKKAVHFFMGEQTGRETLTVFLM